MKSEVSICNKGLQYLGGNPIVSLQEETRGAQLCNELYAQVRDELLESHHWNFAARFVRLAELPQAPLFGYAHAYQLPSDCLAVRYLRDRQPFEVVEERVLYTNSKPALAVLTARVIDPARYSALFIEVLARKLASELAVPLMNSTKLEKTMHAKFVEAFARVAAADSVEGCKQNNGSDGWLQARMR